MNEHSANSSYREKFIEHLFVSFPHLATVVSPGRRQNWCPEIRMSLSREAYTLRAPGDDVAVSSISGEALPD